MSVERIHVPERVEIGGQSYEFYGARVLGRTRDGGQPYVTPHLHLRGVEPYLFQVGSGEMNFGRVSAEGDAVVWHDPVVVQPGSKFLIDEGDVHSFRNVGDQPVDFVFSCPKSHLIDNSAQAPEGDRYIVRHLRNGIPEHFPS